MEWTAKELFILVDSLKRNLIWLKSDLYREVFKVGRTKEDLEMEILELEILLEKLSSWKFREKN
ncbi:hypothetical protein ACYSNU_17670 [Enterococcus sp. LJL120]